MEWLLESLKAFKGQYEFYPDTTFCTNINNAWLKLKKYYNLTKETAVYITATVLHPCIKWNYVNTKWDGKEQRSW